jgi:hypothetical protein
VTVTVLWLPPGLFMAKRVHDQKDHYDPVTQKFLANLAVPPPAIRTIAVLAPPLPVALPLKSRCREKRVLVDADEDAQIELQVQRLAAELGTPLKLSHVLRALLYLLRRAEPHVLARAHQVGPLTRPPNGDLAALGRFEEQLAILLAGAFRELPPRP